MNNLMIDLETLGVGTGAVIASIGAVVFNETGVIHELKINVNIKSCQDVGMRVAAPTLIWWLQQSREAIDATFMQDTMFIGPALLELKSFYEENMCEQVWSHGATFDIPMIDEAARRCKLAPLWPYHAARDTRTLFWLTGISSRDFMNGGMKHSAVDDARAQALAVIAALDKINGWKFVRNSTVDKIDSMLFGESVEAKACNGKPQVVYIAKAEIKTGDPIVLEPVISKLPDLEVPDFLKRTK